MRRPIVDVTLSLSLGLRLSRVGWNSVDEFFGSLGDQVVLASDLLSDILCICFAPCRRHGFIRRVFDRVTTVFFLGDQVINASKSIVDAIIG